MEIRLLALLVDDEEGGFGLWSRSFATWEYGLNVRIGARLGPRFKGLAHYDSILTATALADGTWTDVLNLASMHGRSSPCLSGRASSISTLSQGAGTRRNWSAQHSRDALLIRSGTDHFRAKFGFPSETISKAKWPRSGLTGAVHVGSTAHKAGEPVCSLSPRPRSVTVSTNRPRREMTVECHIGARRAL